MPVKKLIYIGLALVVLVGLFLVFKPDADKAAAPTSTQSGENITFNLVITDDKLVSGGETLTVNEGDNVTIEATSNKETELHVHGYDKEVQLEPGKASKIIFVADKSGRFEIEIHGVDEPISALEVLPKQ